MGAFSVSVEIGATSGGGFAQVEALVDTGAFSRSCFRTGPALCFKSRMFLGLMTNDAEPHRLQVVWQTRFVFAEACNQKE